MSTFIYVIAAALIAAGAGYMIFATCYDDGSVGKLALGCMALGGVSAVWLYLGGELQRIPAHVAFITAGAALFIVRHLARFWKFRHKSKGRL